MPTQRQDQFVHLHVHTDSSMLDGAARLGPLFQQAARLGMPAVAVTDHGNSYAAYDAVQAASKAGIKAIVGLEAYLAPNVPRQHRKPVFFGAAGGGRDDVSGRGAYTHMTLLAETTTGMHNLFRMNSHANFDGFYRKPRIDRELLSTYADGIIATTGCPGGEVQTLIRLGQYDKAVTVAAEFADIFGSGNFYVELMDHGLDIERRVRADLLRLAKQLRLPLLATNDLHYLAKDDAAAHDALLCVNSAAKLADQDRFRFDGTEYWLKPAREMRRLFNGLEEACDNTLLVAERCNIEFTEGVGRLMPRFDVPAGETEETWFRKQVEAGLAARYPGGVPADRRDRADYEMSIIIDKGYAGYYLVTADFINWAKDNGIRVGPGRGSGAGSLCAYAMRITELDPIPYGLLFERFLNPERMSMPDFDVDFDEKRRTEVIHYVTGKYGADHVSAIITMTGIKARQAIKDAAKVLGYPYVFGDQITKLVPPDAAGKGITFDAMFTPDDPRYGEADEFRTRYNTDPDMQKVVDLARGLEGLKRGTGVHAAGVIMSSQPLIDHIPLTLRQNDQQVITGFEYPTCERLGMVKFDFLGLSNLFTIDETLRNIKRNRGIDVRIEDAPLDDPDVYATLARGDTLGIFQVDSSGMQALLRQMRPDHFEDISAALALYRPGPMGADSHTNYALRKNGLQPVTPIHAELEQPLTDILGGTYGLIVYQEQVQQIAQKVAGYSLGAADNLRRAMGKKKKEVLDAEYGPFSTGMRGNGYSDDAIKTLWDILVPFSDYAFNKAHTAAYGMITYWTAWLKTHYPAEYMAALLTTNLDNKDKTAIYLNECRHMGVNVLVPDVNTSLAAYTPDGDNIRVGLAAVRNVGTHIVEAILDARDRHGPFTGFTDFLDTIPPAACRTQIVDSLIKAGAFDSLHPVRAALTHIADEAVTVAAATKKQTSIGQDTLFGAVEDATTLGDLHVTIPDHIHPWDKRTRLAHEKTMLGLYVSDHPLNGVARALRARADTSIGTILADNKPLPRPVTVGGLITGITRKVTRTGDPWAIIHVEDLDGAIDMMCFPRTYKETSHLLSPDSILLFTGRVDEDERSGGIRFALNAAKPAPGLAGGGAAPLDMVVPERACTPELVTRLRDILQAHPGETPTRVRLTRHDQPDVLLRLGDDLHVHASPALIGELKVLLGHDAVPAR